MGLLSMIARDFAITEDQAGHIIAAYALGVVIGAPTIAALTGRIPRRRLLLVLMAVFTVANTASGFAPSYGWLMAARFLSGLPHGAYFSVAGLAAASMAEKGQRGRALALVGLGFSVATVAGVPAVQALGSHLGWHYAYLFVGAVGLAATLALWLLMPHMTKMKPTDPRTELSAFTRPQVLATLLMGTVGFGGMFAVYTYITWTMTERAGLGESWMWVVLMAYGLGMLVGNLLGGHLADRGVMAAIGFALFMILLSLVTFYFTSQWVVPGVITFACIGVFGSALVPALQIRLMDVAGDAQTLAAALNHSALNLANASGAALGGAVISAGLGYAAPALAGAAMAASALVIWGIVAATSRGARRRR